MPISILATKFHPPAVRSALVERPALHNRLTQGLRGKVTIISAPPGFGKSTLVAEWIASRLPERAAWYSLDEDDNTPVRFFRHLAAALQTVQPDSMRSLEILLESPSPEPRELTAALINDLTESAGEKYVLVLDDYHYITQQPIHDAIAYLIDHQPDNLYLIFISRADPPLPLGRWRVRGHLTEIRADDLRFTEAEAAEFLNRVMGLTLRAEDIHALQARTEGWAAGLQLAALSLQQAANPTEMIAAFAGSHRYVAEYLTDEVLSRQPETIREFLLQTSLLERFNAALCNAVLGIENAAANLTELERANLFIIPLDEESNWYRYHHLFADLLRRRLEQEQPARVKDLHRRAAAWYEQHGFMPDAVRHWIAADEPRRVAELVEQIADEIWGKAELAVLIKRVESLPESVLAEHPSLSAFLGWTWIWLGHGSERILPLLDRAEQNCRGNLPSLGRLNLVRSVTQRILHNNPDESLRLAKLALTQLAPTDLQWRRFAHLETAITTHASGRPLAEAETAYEETSRISEQAGDRVTAWIAACARVQVVSERGELKRALALNRQLLESAQRIPSTQVRGWVHVNQAALLYQINDLEGARREATLTQELEQQLGSLPDVSMRLYDLLTRLELVDGQPNLARQAAENFIALARRSGITNAVDWANAVRAALLYRLEDWPAFETWAQTYQPPRQPLFFPYRLGTLMFIRFLMRQKDWQECRRLTDEQIQLAREAGYLEYEMEIQIVRTLMEREAGNLPLAFQALERALEIGQAGGYVRVFLDEGERMKNLLDRFHSIRKNEYATVLLVAFGRSAPLDQSILIEPLTEREVEVLRWLAQGLSNAEIAEKLYLSVGTVKTHVKHIYGKLGVDDRVKAAGKARELGLLP
ncbi:MAG: LuxR family transcriptional regulator [Bellilinea sp.]|nr:MAG: LuxR family transcriptional regulator [Bellilinea sp.]